MSVDVIEQVRPAPPPPALQPAEKPVGPVDPRRMAVELRHSLARELTGVFPVYGNPFADALIPVAPPDMRDPDASRIDTAMEAVRAYAAGGYGLEDMTKSEVAAELERYRQVKESGNYGSVFEEWKVVAHKPKQVAIDGLLMRLAWRVEKEKYVADRIDLLQKLYGKAAEVTPVNRPKGGLGESEKLRLSGEKQAVEKIIDDVMAKMERSPDSIKEIPGRYQLCASLAGKLREAEETLLEDPAKAKEIGIEVAETYASQFLDEALKTNERKVRYGIMEKFHEEASNYNVKVQKLEDRYTAMTEPCKVEAVRGYLKKADEIFRSFAAAGMEMSLQEGDSLAQEIAGFGEKLGAQRYDILKLFKRGKEGKITGVYSFSLDEIVRLLDEQLEDGVDLKGGKAIVTRQGIEGWDTDLARSLSDPVIGHGELIKSLAAKKASFKMPDGSTLDGTGALRLYGHLINQGPIPGTIRLSLISHKGEPEIALTIDSGSNLAFTHILKTGLRQNSRYGSLPTEHLFITDKSTGQTFDIRSVLPQSVGLYLDFDTMHGSVFEADIGVRPGSPRHISYSELKTKEDAFSIFHELGHLVFGAHVDELVHKGENDAVDILGQYGLEIYNKAYAKIKRAMTDHERGAWARGIFMIRDLKSKGIDMGMKPEEMRDFADVYLATYERRLPPLYPECGRPFVRPERLNEIEKKHAGPR